MKNDRDGFITNSGQRGDGASRGSGCASRGGGGRVKRTRGGGVNVTTSWQTRGKQEGTAPQKLAGLSRGQEAAAAARREAS